jgi:ABC-2 type transport system ATP-binding protein
MHASDDPEDFVVSVSDLSVSFGTNQALRSVSLTAQRGEVLGVIGPNGAGKTTLVESVGGISRGRRQGLVKVCGTDPAKDRGRARQLIGMLLQSSAFPSRVRVGEICSLYEGIYGRPGATEAMLAAFGLSGCLGT